jgi:hypothetical protein
MVCVLLMLSDSLSGTLQTNGYLMPRKNTNLCNTFTVRTLYSQPPVILLIVVRCLIISQKSPPGSLITDIRREICKDLSGLTRFFPSYIRLADLN